MTLGVKAQAADFEHFPFLDDVIGGRGPPQHSSHAGDELAQAIGLAHVVVGAHFEAYNGVDLALVDPRRGGAAKPKRPRLLPRNAGRRAKEGRRARARGRSRRGRSRFRRVTPRA